MPDSIQPVAAMIRPPDPGQSINTLSGLYGIQQQRQALQTGQYQQATAQAESQQAQQKNQELQKVSALMQSVHDGAYRKSDGSLDRQKFADDVTTVAPAYGGPIATSALAQANEIVQNQKAKQDLTDSARASLGTVLTTLAKDPNTRRDDVLNGYTQWMQDHKDDPAAFRVGLAQAALLPQNDADPKFRETLGKYAATLTGQPTTAPSVTDTGTQLKPGVTSQITGAPTFAGAPINKQSVVTTPAGPQAVVTPAKGTLAPLRTTGAGPELNQTTAQVETGRGIAAGVTQRVQQAQSAANNTTQAQDALTRARAILDSPESPNTGAGFQRVQGLRNLMSTMGIDTQGATDANSLVKNLARYEAARATQAGLGGTDAARELAHNGSPNVNVDNAALRGIVTQSLATEKALAAYANIQTRTKNPDALSKNEADFRSIPNLIQGYEYGLARNPQEAEAFLQKHGLSRADMVRTRALIKEFEARQ